MTTFTTLPLNPVKSTAPFVVAFGAALVVSSALGTTVPLKDWTSIPVGVSRGAFFSLDVVTSTGPSVVNLVTAATNTPAESISRLRVLSGLTADQVGRLLGVSRRSVQNWVAGNAMALQHEEQVSRLLSIIQSLPGSTADERRAALLDSRSGQSLFQQLLAQRGDASRVQTRPLSVGERIAL